ncbi:DUF4012 domain-containing protein [Ktedonosporobacter rubrisoli]|uniref:DUF4012 domain-containing protein n=1 Tax=Ktedonosporobacter rubrisoli TaxID=2509675 RepID=A0A4P6K1B8_KTERU|nr:DUF4012 domain-containing protein [Ktedonosporobacter rubrisoli]QBD81460.1 DUF4012 domain-containing protein [Ktedonosporobacter rubrisoli]
MAIDKDAQEGFSAGIMPQEKPSDLEYNDEWVEAEQWVEPVKDSPEADNVEASTRREDSSALPTTVLAPESLDQHSESLATATVAEIETASKQKVPTETGQQGQAEHVTAQPGAEAMQEAALEPKPAENVAQGMAAKLSEAKPKQETPALTQEIAQGEADEQEAREQIISAIESRVNVLSEQQTQLPSEIVPTDVAEEQPEVTSEPKSEEITEPASEPKSEPTTEEKSEEITEPTSGEITESKSGETSAASIEEKKEAPAETETGEQSKGAKPRPFSRLADKLPDRVRVLALRHRVIAIGLLVLVLFGIVAPLLVTASYGIRAYATYTSLRTHASDGYQHLLNIKTIFSGAKAHPTGVLDVAKLQQAGKELQAARSDFVKVRDMLDNSDVLHTITQYLPQYRATISSARAASQIGIDVSEIGQRLIATALTFAPRFHGGSILSSNTKAPLITAHDIDLLSTTLAALLPLVDDMQVQARHISFSSLPLDSHSLSQLQQYLQMLPQVKNVLLQAQSLLPSAGWLLGVEQPRTFLVQTMDRSELRATGGFTGQFGELQISQGRIAPFSLRDISAVEYSDNNATLGQQAPQAYRSWWPFANWGLRDSNLSADFPASARIAIEQYNLEVHRKVDGVVLFTPFLVEHIMNITGPIQVPRYNETITAQNLEQRLHYYQLDNAAIRKIELIEHVEDPAQARKLFTSEVAHQLMDRVRHASPEELMAIGLQLLQDLKTRDLQIYLTNTQLEDFLVRYGYAGQIDRSPTHDGLYIVQANVSASKASQYVRTTIHDTVSLDPSGGATHLLQLRLAYTQIGPVYGLDTYRDYVRVYVPPSAKFLWGNGFDTGEPLCGGPLAACAPQGIYPGDELVCPTGQYQAGASAPMLGDPYAGQWHPLDKIGPPNNLKSDEPGRGMFAGYVIVPKNCTMTVTLSWYVPPLGTYNLLVQRQAATFPELDLSILSTPGDCAALKTAGLYFNGILTNDMSFALKAKTNSRDTTTSCYEQPGV